MHPLTSCCRLECFARIAVSGFILDPEVPVSSLLSAISTSPPDAAVPPSSSVDPHVSIARHPSLGLGSQRRDQEGLSWGDRFRQLRINLMRPFALSHAPHRENSTSSKTTRRRSDTVQSQTPMMEKITQVHSHIRNPLHPSFLSTAFKSDNDDILSLPFRLSVERSHTVTRRNLPYMRQSWLRIDIVAVLSYWISFALAMAGAERGTYHIGIFRALSVLRTARLLAITSGTTVCPLQNFLSGYPYSLLRHPDNHALAEDRSTAFGQCSILRAVCYDTLFVRHLLTHSLTALIMRYTTASSEYSRSRGLSDEVAISLQPWAKIPYH